MSKHFLFLLVIISSLAYASVQDNSVIENINPFVVIDTQSNCKKILALNDTSSNIERRGCCSHHGGVCGCSNGRAKCCDGSLSPSCGCD